MTGHKTNKYLNIVCFIFIFISFEHKTNNKRRRNNLTTTQTTPQAKAKESKIKDEL
jgi:hypothetical protein